MTSLEWNSYRYACDRYARIFIGLRVCGSPKLWRGENFIRTVLILTCLSPQPSLVHPTPPPTWAIWVPILFSPPKPTPNRLTPPPPDPHSTQPPPSASIPKRQLVNTEGELFT